jgi:hypothetical protein
MENADLLTNATATAEWGREEERLLETEITVLQAKLELMREVNSRLTGRPKSRRARPAPKLVEADAPAASEPPELVA